MVDIVIDENPLKHVKEYDGILVGTNCYQVMRNGFQKEVVSSYPYVIECNYRTKYGDSSKLGDIVECKKENQPLFILMFTTFGYNFKGCNSDFFDYEALAKCLKVVNILYKGYKFASCMIGCSEFDGNADKNRILDIVNNEVKDFDLTLYDYKQISHSKLNQKEYFKSLKQRYAKNKERKRVELAGKNQQKA
jgi:hypothetical protein